MYKWRCTSRDFVSFFLSSWYFNCNLQMC